MKKILILLLLLSVVSGAKIAGFKVDYLTDYRTEYIKEKPVDVYYSKQDIKKIKENKTYTVLAIISDKNHYGAPWYDELFNERLQVVCKYVGGNAVLWNEELSDFRNNFHVYEVIKVTLNNKLKVTYDEIIKRQKLMYEKIEKNRKSKLSGE
jgi:hypothetical protein